MLNGDEQAEGRNDNVVNMCEMKFYKASFCVDKDYHGALENRQGIPEEYIPRRSFVHRTRITTFVLKYNEGFGNVITLDDLLC